MKNKIQPEGGANKDAENNLNKLNVDAFIQRKDISNLGANPPDKKANNQPLFIQRRKISGRTDSISQGFY